jgi:hypothetical protein
MQVTGQWKMVTNRTGRKMEKRRQKARGREMEMAAKSTWPKGGNGGEKHVAGRWKWRQKALGRKIEMAAKSTWPEDGNSGKKHVAGRWKRREKARGRKIEMAAKST